MELTPFKRPTPDEAAENLRSICRLSTTIEADYACPLAAHPPSKWDLSEWSPAPDPAEVKVGDLHDWDKLVDGCLYYDGNRYAMCLEGHAAWAYDGNDVDRLSDSIAVGRYVYDGATENARVIAAGLKTPDDFRRAIREHAASLKTGGAK